MLGLGTSQAKGYTYLGESVTTIAGGVEQQKARRNAIGDSHLLIPFVGLFTMVAARWASQTALGQAGWE
ncbi:unnamed protein product [Victoria cruziana]